MASWDDIKNGYDRKGRDWAERGLRSPMRTAWTLIVLLTVFGLGVRVIGGFFGWFGEAATVARQELGPRALLDKYEWFKDAHAQLDKKVADIAVYESRVTDLRKTFGEDASQWPRDIREEYRMDRSEVAGVIASYNLLAAQYNAQMAKINYRFTNVGMLPDGATEPLPREYAPYKEGV